LTFHISLFAGACSPGQLPVEADHDGEPVSPGGVVDIVGRPLAAIMEKNLRQPVRDDQQTGAAARSAWLPSRKPTDGYTVLMGCRRSDLPGLRPHQWQDAGVRALRLRAIALVTADPTVLVGAPTALQTLKDFVDAAKANPGKINYSRPACTGRCMWRWKSSPTRRHQLFTCLTRAAGRR